MASYTDSKPERTMALIANLIARANHKNTPPAEAELCRMQAEKLMQKHRIDESMLTTEERAQRGVKVASLYWQVYNMDLYQDADLINYYYRIASFVADHVGARYLLTTKRNDEGETWVVAHVFGFESDLAFGNLLLQAATIAYGEHMFPKVDREASDAVNIYRMRSAGMERNRIAAALWGSDMKDGKAHGKVAAIYKRTAAALGEDPTALMGKGNSMKVYRFNYAHAFCTTLESRLRIAKSAVEPGEMVLASRADEVLEAFYTAYPRMRPSTSADVEHLPPCPRCAAAKSGWCRDHKPRFYKAKTIAFNAAARNRGADAARRVDLHRAGQRRPLD